MDADPLLMSDRERNAAFARLMLRAFQRYKRRTPSHDQHKIAENGINATPKMTQKKARRDTGG